jgi:peptidoglycan/xylan/chitin deacetylase (PgdA/CDA1 family)
MKRPHLGRAGAGALLVVACLLVAQAINSGAATVNSVQFSSLAARAEAAHFGPPLAVQRAPIVSPAAVPDQSVVPVGRSSIHLPILMFHYIRVVHDPRDQLGFNLSVTPDDFSRQLDWLAANGFHPIDFNDVRQYFAGQNPLPAKPIVLTFDDGYRDFYTNAYPILWAHHFKAVSYVISGYVGGPNYMTWDMVRELDAHGIEIGAHTFSHIDLTKASATELHRQLVDSEGDFVQELGHPVLDFCYPAGKYNSVVTAAVQAAGYQTATTTEMGTLHSMTDRFTWSRVRVSGGEQLEKLIADLGTSENTIKLPAEPAYIRFPALQRQPLTYSRPQPLPLPTPLGDLPLIP